MIRKKGIYILDSRHWESIYGPEERSDIAKWVDIEGPMQTRESIAANPGILHDVEIIFSGWGAPLFDHDFLDAAPNLRIVFYGSGGIKNIVTEAFWTRGIMLSGTTSAFGIPVAEYTLSQILFCLKHGWQLALETKRLRTYAPQRECPGAFFSTVGLVSMGTIGRLVREKLRSFDLKIIAFDPLMSGEEAEELNITLCSLDEVFTEADVISLHAPWLPETEKMIRAEHFAAMKPGASFINTSRGAVVDEGGLIEVFSERKDLFAVLDVTWPEPPLRDSGLYDLTNVIITPHIAGCLGRECRRGGRMVVEELRRYLYGEKLLGQISEDRLGITA
jgi:phosphoglycerate dehydrogenase-like enzyme